MVNKCRNKQALKDLLDEFNVTYGTSANSDQLKSLAIQHLMQTKVPSTQHNYLGFGKFAALTYGQTIINQGSYTKWCIQTAREEKGCHWRLKRYATWAQSIGTGEKAEIARFLENTETLSPPRTSRVEAAASSSRSVEEASSTWSDMEMIPAENSATRPESRSWKPSSRR